VTGSIRIGFEGEDFIANLFIPETCIDDAQKSFCKKISDFIMRAE